MWKQLFCRKIEVGWGFVEFMRLGRVFGRNYVVWSGFCWNYTVGSGFSWNYAVGSGFWRNYVVWSGFCWNYTVRSGFSRNCAVGSGFWRNYVVWSGPGFNEIILLSWGLVETVLLGRVWGEYKCLWSGLFSVDRFSQLFVWQIYLRKSTEGKFRKSGSVTRRD